MSSRLHPEANTCSPPTFDLKPLMVGASHFESMVGKVRGGLMKGQSKVIDAPMNDQV